MPQSNMLYFEDFMEAIENLPDEVNESLTTVRQLDLLTQNILEPLSETNKTFFENCKYNRLSECEKSAQRGEIIKQYEKALFYCEEKKAVVEKLFTMYQNLMRKLDGELEKFRLELEADNSGITEQIEKKVSNILGKSPCIGVKNDKRRQRFRYQPTAHFKNPFLLHRRIVDQACRTVLKSSASRPAKLDGPMPSGRLSGMRKSLTAKGAAQKKSDSSDYLSGPKLEDAHAINRRVRSFDYGAQPDPFEMDATTDHKSYGHNVNYSLKSSATDEDGDSIYGSANMGPKNSPYFGLGSEHGSSILDRSIYSSARTHRLGSTGSHDAGEADVRTTPNSTGSPIGWHHGSSGGSRRQRTTNTSRRRDAFLGDLGADANVDDHFGLEGSGSSVPGSDVFEPSSFASLVPDTVVEDEDQKRYCICNDVSYGDMIACDNPKCPFEWFHYACVNLSVAPKGDWYCPNCIKTQKNVRKRYSRR